MKHAALLPALLTVATPAFAEPTPVKILAISQDAKFVGDSMGGVEVVLRDAETGKMLAKGKTAGGTGDTGKIMQATGRSPSRATTDAAHFSTTLDIDKPTLVRVELRGPLGRPLTIQRVASERWLIPGVSAATGDGWTVELPGLAIQTEMAGAMTAGRVTLLTAKVALMCGCPITPGGLWDAADYEVTAELRRKGRLAERFPLRFSASPGQFSADITPASTGKAELWLIARNTRTGNSGVARMTVRIGKNHD